MGDFDNEPAQAWPIESDDTDYEDDDMYRRHGPQLREPQTWRQVHNIQQKEEEKYVWPAAPYDSAEEDGVRRHPEKRGGKGMSLIHLLAIICMCACIPAIAAHIAPAPQRGAPPMLCQTRLTPLAFQTPQPYNDKMVQMRKSMQQWQADTADRLAAKLQQEFKQEFETLAGRVWNPKLRGHDRHGRFRVEILETDHPVTRAMTSFETTDELYTCLDGTTPITVLAPR